jgi:hypothetical protein
MGPRSRPQRRYRKSRVGTLMPPPRRRLKMSISRGPRPFPLVWLYAMPRLVTASGPDGEATLRLPTLRSGSNRSSRRTAITWMTSPARSTLPGQASMLAFRIQVSAPGCPGPSGLRWLPWQNHPDAEPTVMLRLLRSFAKGSGSDPKPWRFPFQNLFQKCLERQAGSETAITIREIRRDGTDPNVLRCPATVPG